jgi:hypothetical protein
MDDEDEALEREAESLRAHEAVEAEKKERRRNPKAFIDMVRADVEEARLQAAGGGAVRGRSRYVENEAELSDQEGAEGLGKFGGPLLAGADGKLVAKIVEEDEERRAIAIGAEDEEELKRAIVDELDADEQELEGNQDEKYREDVAKDNERDEKRDREAMKGAAAGNIKIVRQLARDAVRGGRGRSDARNPATFARGAAGADAADDKLADDENEELRMAEDEKRRRLDEDGNDHFVSDDEDEGGDEDEGEDEEGGDGETGEGDTSAEVDDENSDYDFARSFAKGPRKAAVRAASSREPSGVRGAYASAPAGPHHASNAAIQSYTDSMVANFLGANDGDSDDDGVGIGTGNGGDARAATDIAKQSAGAALASGVAPRGLFIAPADEAHLPAPLGAAPRGAEAHRGSQSALYENASLIARRSASIAFGVGGVFSGAGLGSLSLPRLSSRPAPSLSSGPPAIARPSDAPAARSGSGGGGGALDGTGSTRAVSSIAGASSGVAAGAISRAGPVAAEPASPAVLRGSSESADMPAPPQRAKPFARTSFAGVLGTHSSGPISAAGPAAFKSTAAQADASTASTAAAAAAIAVQSSFGLGGNSQHGFSLAAFGSGASRGPSAFPSFGASSSASMGGFATAAGASSRRGVVFSSSSAAAPASAPSSSFPAAPSLKKRGADSNQQSQLEAVVTGLKKAKKN